MMITPLSEPARVNNTPQFSFNNDPITREEIINAISLLKNKNTPDHDGLSTSLVKKLPTNLLCLCILFFKSPMKQVMSQTN